MYLQAAFVFQRRKTNPQTFCALCEVVPRGRRWTVPPSAPCSPVVNDQLVSTDSHSNHRAVIGGIHTALAKPIICMFIIYVYISLYYIYIYIYIQYTFDIQLNYALSITYISCINVLFFTRYPPPSKEAARVADELEAYLVALGASLGLGPARGPAEARR